MRQQKPKLSLDSIRFATRMNQDRLTTYRQVLADVEKAKRLNAAECAICFYVKGRIGGAAMTSSNCRLCDEQMVFGNTCTDELCWDCAKANSLCKHCGATLDSKERRKPPFSSKSQEGADEKL